MNTFIIRFIGNAINFISYISSKYAAKLAIKIFSTPKKGKINDVEADYLKSAIQDDVIYNDFSIKTYRWNGEKETILLAHGWESNAYRWKDLIALLKIENYNIIAIDAPAHGYSGSKIFNAVLYSKCIHVVTKKFKPDVIIGHSIGGTASAIALHDHNILCVKKLVTLGAPSNFVGLVNNYTKMMRYNKKVTNAMNTFFLKHFGRLPEHYSASIFLKDIKAKGLIIHDKKDRIISYKDALDYSKYYKNATLIKTIGFGHGLKSEKIYADILNFLKA